MFVCVCVQQNHHYLYITFIFCKTVISCDLDTFLTVNLFFFLVLLLRQRWLLEGLSIISTSVATCSWNVCSSSVCVCVCMFITDVNALEICIYSVCVCVCVWLCCRCTTILHPILILIIIHLSLCGPTSHFMLCASHEFYHPTPPPFWVVSKEIISFLKKWTRRHLKSFVELCCGRFFVISFFFVCLFRQWRKCWLMMSS